MALPRTLEKETGYAAPTWGTNVTGTAGIAAGTSWDGWVVDLTEHVPELAWPASVAIFDRMLKDEKIREVINALVWPIRGARWRLDPNGARDEVVKACSTDFDLPVLGSKDDQPKRRVRGRFSWNDHLRHALLSLSYGHMPFEQVYNIVNGQARLAKLAPRMPQTLSAIRVARDGGLIGIEQWPTGLPTNGPSWTSSGQPITIPVDRLVMYCHEREGGGWQGQSILRAAYRSWLLKDRTLRVHAMTIERAGLPTPIGKGAPGMTQTQLDQLAQAARDMRAGETAGAGLPYGADLGFVGIKGTLPDTLAFLKWLDEGIAGLVLAEFLKLGSSETGSRAVGEVFLDLFQQASDSVTTEIADTATAHGLEDYVDLNWGEDEQAPRVVCEKVGSDQRLTAQALMQLMQVGAITPDPVLEEFIRDAFGIPQRATPQPVLPAPTPPSPAGGTAAAARPRVHQVAAATNRDPHDHEAHVDWNALDTAWQARLSDIMATWQGIRSAQIDELADQVDQALRAGDLAALGSLSASTGQGTDALLLQMQLLVQTAATEAIAEAARQGVTITQPDLTALTDRLTARAAAVDHLLASGLSNAATRQALLWASPDVDPAAAAQAVKEALNGLSDTYLSDQLGGALTAAQNTGRLAVFRSGGVKTVYASELLDANTCVNCKAEDGKQFADLMAAEQDYPTGGYVECLGGPRCRGTLVATFETEQDPTVE
jgi:hypothetical protein